MDTGRRSRRWFVPITVAAAIAFFGAIELGARGFVDVVPKVPEQEALAALGAGASPTVLVFSVPGCKYCVGAKQMLRDIAGETGESVRYLEVDLEDARTLATRYDVNAVPTILVFDEGGDLRGRAAAIANRGALEKFLR